MGGVRRGWWVNSFFALSVILATLVYPIIWSTLHKVFWVSFFVCLYDVSWTSFWVHIIAEKSYLLYFVLAISETNDPYAQ